MSYHCGFAVPFVIIFPLFKVGYRVESAVMNHIGKQNYFTGVAEVFISKSSIPTTSNDSNNTVLQNNGQNIVVLVVFHFVTL